MSTAVPIQSLVNMTATLASQQTHAHHGTQSSAVNPVHCITDGFDERDWDAVTLLYHTHIKTLRLREREQQGRELVQSVLSNMGPGEAGLRQLAAVNLLMLSKPRSPRKARSCTGRGTGELLCVLLERAYTNWFDYKQNRKRNRGLSPQQLLTPPILLPR